MPIAIAKLINAFDLISHALAFAIFLTLLSKVSSKSLIPARGLPTSSIILSNDSNETIQAAIIPTPINVPKSTSPTNFLTP